MQDLTQKANQIKTVEEFEEFCLEHVRSEWGEMEFIIPLIIKNLSNEIDIKNDLKEWEKFLGRLYRYTAPYANTALDKLYNSYPKYPIECLFELIVYNVGEEYGVYAPLWYEPMIAVYDTYSHKIDKTLFDKYLMFINNNRKYITALLVKENFDIPKESIYADMNELLKSRLRYGNQHLTLEDIAKMNIDKLNGAGYVNISPERYEKEGYYDIDGNFVSFVTDELESAIFETEEYREIKPKLSIYNVGEEYSFDDFLLYKWGVVKYLTYLNEYGVMEQEGGHFYKRFIISLIPKALEENNLRALVNLKDIIMMFSSSIPEDLLTKALTNRSLWKQADAFKKIFKEMKETSAKCFNECTEEAPYTGDFGQAYITFKYKKGFSVWLLLNGYAQHESNGANIVLFDSALNVYEMGHCSRGAKALHCAGEILDKNKIACDVRVWMD